MSSRLLLLAAAGLGVSIAGACVNGAGAPSAPQNPGNPGEPTGSSSSLPSGGQDPSGGGQDSTGGGQDPSSGGQDPSSGGQDPASGIGDPAGGGTCLDCGTYTCTFTDSTGTSQSTVVQLTTLQNGNGCGVANESGSEILCNGTIEAPVSAGGPLQVVGSWSRSGAGIRGTAPIDIPGVASGVSVSFNCTPGGSVSNSSSSSSSSSGGTPSGGNGSSSGGVTILPDGGVIITFDAG